MKLSKTKEWFVNPWIDTLLLVNIPILLIAIVIIVANLIRPLPITEWATGQALGLIQKIILLHFVATIIIIYSDSRNVRNKTVFFLIPALLLSGLFVARLYFGLKDLTSTISYHLVIFHELVQYTYIIGVFLFIKKYSALDSVIYCAALIIGPIYPYIYNVSVSDINFYGRVIPWNVTPAVLEGFKFVSLAALSVFTVRQFYLFQTTKKIQWFPVLMVLTANGLYYFPILILKSNLFFVLVSFKLHHAFQYATWLILYCQLKYKSQIVEGARFISYLSNPKRVIILILFVVAVTSVVTLLTNSLIAATHQDESIKETSYLLLHVYLDLVFFCNIPKISSEIVQ